MESIIKRNIKDLDYPLIMVMILISIYSVIAIYTATYGKTDPNIPSHIIVRQMVWEMLSYIAMFAMMFMDYHTLSKYRWWIFGISILLLVAVFVFPRVNGAHSWIHLPGGGSIQPSEFAKLTFIIWTADYMAKMNEKEYPDYSLKGLLPIFIAFIVPFLLILKEPALGQALVLLVIMFAMLIVYVKRRHLQVLIAIAAVVVITFGSAVAVYPNQTIKMLEHQHVLPHYQTMRLISFIDPTYSPTGSGYQVLEAEIAVGSGSVFGEGLLKGSQTNGSWVPFQWTDFIFSAIAEQLGFVGSSVLIMLFLVMLYRMVKVAMTSLDDFGAYLIAGSVGMFAFQIFENIGMNLVISPATGITLPFVSYGGSSLIVNFLSIGIVLSVSLRRRTLRFD